MNILGSILGLGIYAGMETLAAEKATDTNRTFFLAAVYPFALNKLRNIECRLAAFLPCTGHGAAYRAVRPGGD